MAVATALVYMLAAVVSLLVFALTKLGEAVIFCAEITNKLKPELPDETMQVRRQRSVADCACSPPVYASFGQCLRRHDYESSVIHPVHPAVSSQAHCTLRLPLPL